MLKIVNFHLNIIFREMIINNYLEWLYNLDWTILVITGICNRGPNSKKK